MKNSTNKVDFIGIGAPKCATSWIAECLVEHPEVCIPQKELHFFEKNYSKGIVWYLDYFKDCKNKVKGEFTPQYLSFEKAPERIKKYFPDVRLIVCLRNPIERAYSSYWHKRNKFGIDSSFEKVIEEMPEIKERSMYYKQLRNYLRYFKKRQILILIYEDIEEDPAAFIKKVYRFLDIDKNVIPPSLNKRVNITRRYKIAGVHKTLVSLHSSIRSNKTTSGVIKKLGIYKAGKFIQKVNTKARNYPKMNTGTREKLRKEYRDEIVGLEKLIGRDLSFWK